MGKRSYLVRFKEGRLIIEVCCYDFGTGVNESFGRYSRCIPGYGAHFPLGLQEGLYNGSALHACCSVNSDDSSHDCEVRVEQREVISDWGIFLGLQRRQGQKHQRQCGIV